MKPLSPKTLEKMYAERGFSQDTAALLHDYYLCFSNLYGVISVGDAWDVFNKYEGTRPLRKEDFIAFSGIVQREAGHPYRVLELKEVYTGETTEDPAERLIVNDRLIGVGYGKYTLLYNVVDQQQNKPYYLPAERTLFLAHVRDRFYLSPDGEKMVRYLGRLKTDGKYKDDHGKVRGDILDSDGNPVAGKCLSDFVCYTEHERFSIDYAKSETKKEQLRREYGTTALDKILNRIFTEIQTGGYLPDESTANTLEYLIEFLDRDLGVEITPARLERFSQLFMELNNHSHLWLNRGWSPDELSRRSGFPQSAAVGPGLKKMLAEGTMDRAEFERRMKALGIEVFYDK